MPLAPGSNDFFYMVLRDYRPGGGETGGGGGLPVATSAAVDTLKAKATEILISTS